MTTQTAVPTSVLDSRLREIDEQIQRLSIERDLLRTLRQRAVPVSTNGGVPQLTLEPDAKARPTSQIVLDYIREHPGLTSSELADLLLEDERLTSAGGSDP